MQLDQLGLEYTTSNPAVPGLFLESVDNYLGSKAVTMPSIETVLAEDAELPLASMFRAYLLKLAADPKFRTPIQKTIDQLDNHDGLNDRERKHLAALKSWHADQLDETAAIFDDLIVDYPHDILAIKIAHHLHFYGGGAGAMLASLERALPRWTADDPYYGYMKGMHCFALEESGRYEEAESAGKEALEHNIFDIWAAHAVTHIYQMQSRFDEGVAFVQGFDGKWDDINNFVNHLHWHEALQHIGRGDAAKALAIYDALLIKPLKDDFYLDVCNATSLLWRLEMLGIDVGKRWEELAQFADRRVTDDELIFTTLHYLMVPAVLQDNAMTERCLGKLAAWSKDSTTQAAIVEKVGLPLGRAIAAFGSENPSAGAEIISTIKDDIYLIGGSHAQRNLFELLENHYN